MLLYSEDRQENIFLFQFSVDFLLQLQFLCFQTGFNDVKLNNPVLELHMREP